MSAMTATTAASGGEERAPMACAVPLLDLSQGSCSVDGQVLPPGRYSLEIWLVHPGGRRQQVDAPVDVRLLAQGSASVAVYGRGGRTEVAVGSTADSQVSLSCASVTGDITVTNGGPGSVHVRSVVTESGSVDLHGCGVAQVDVGRGGRVIC